MKAGPRGGPGTPSGGPRTQTRSTNPEEVLRLSGGPGTLRRSWAAEAAVGPQTQCAKSCRAQDRDDPVALGIEMTV